MIYEIEILMESLFQGLVNLAQLISMGTFCVGIIYFEFCSVKKILIKTH